MDISLQPTITLSSESLQLPCCYLPSVLGAIDFPAQFPSVRILSRPSVDICLHQAALSLTRTLISQSSSLVVDMNQIIISLICQVPLSISNQGHYTSQ